MAIAVQRSFDDLGAPLAEVPFCVLDIETTGGPADSLGITEIAAQRYVGGVLQGELNTLVNPGMPIPPFITALTGITHAMVIRAPDLAEVMPSFLEFLGDAVIVGHNVRYDLSFLNAAAEHHGYGRLPNRSVDTLALARRLVGRDTRNLKLETLAAHFRAPVMPTHRALDDVKATAHILWELLGQAGTIGVTHLDDLVRLPTARGRPNYGKIHLTESLPRRPGVYLFRDRDGTVIYVGKAKDLRSRVRGYFYGDTRRSITRLLAELDSIDHRVCATELEAEITELRLIAAHLPRHNRASKPGKAPHWVRVTDEPFPRLSLVRKPEGRALAHLGPFAGRGSARLAMEAIWDATAIRRCTGKPGSRDSACAFAQLGVAACPCDGRLSEGAYRSVVDGVLAGLGDSPAVLLDPLVERMTRLAALRRFEEAAWVRDRHQALARAIQRRIAWQRLQAAGSIHAVSDHGGALIEGGSLVTAWPDPTSPPLHALPIEPPPPSEVPGSATDAAEAALIWRWLTDPGTTVVDVTGTAMFEEPAVALPERIAV